MGQRRRYRLLCPVGRALDVVGDRWALLIVRDLHAGPARFQELQEGLGVATNLLTTRLEELTDAGLIHKRSNRRHEPYELTDLGRQTDRLLWELVRMGAMIDPDPDTQYPGNLRALALPLRLMLSAVEERSTMTVRLHIDDEVFTVDTSPDRVDVIYGPTDRQPDLVLRTCYEEFIDAAEGQISLEQFRRDHLEVVDGADRVAEFAAMMTPALAIAELGGPRRRNG